MSEPTEFGGTDVRVAVVSMSARHPEGRDAEYLEWHGLDHLPEQFRLAGIRAGTRWVSTPACRAARAASEGRYDEVDHVVAYLLAEPVASTLDDFFGLGAALREAGRMPVRLPPVELAGWELQSTAAAEAALVGADVLPWRPMRSVYVLLEEGLGVPIGALLAVPGVAGGWTYDGSARLHDRLAPMAGWCLTTLFLDRDPAVVGADLAPVLADRWASTEVIPHLAAPFVTVTPFEWDRHLP
ncbi:MAG: hypothetical protein Q8K72_14605 [Acidimicrobiales bacterium]|nr:hypothetical protein [Acidimicrobiales bacterium]